MIKHYENCAATTYAIPVMHKIKQKYLNDTQFRAMLDSTSEVNRRLDSQKIEVSDAFLEYIFEVGFIEGQKAGVADASKKWRSRYKELERHCSGFFNMGKLISEKD